MIRIDFGTLFELEQDDAGKKDENRNKMRDFIALCEQYEATLVEQRDWNTRDLIHFVAISINVTITMTIVVTNRRLPSGLMSSFCQKN